MDVLAVVVPTAIGLCGLFSFCFFCMYRKTKPDPSIILLSNELRSAIFTACTSTMSFQKQQQWYAVFYALTLMGGFVALAETSRICDAILALLALAVTLVTGCFVIGVHFGIRDNRQLAWDTGLTVYGARMGIDKDLSPWRDFRFLFLFLGIVTGAFLVAAYVILDG